MEHKLLSASTISGDRVVNATGEDLGSIHELMINTGSGKIEYAVLSFGGVLGLGDKYFAVPFTRFDVDREKQRLVLNIDKQRLQEAPGFDKDDWPDFADPAFRTSVADYYSA